MLDGPESPGLYLLIWGYPPWFAFNTFLFIFYSCFNCHLYFNYCYLTNHFFFNQNTQTFQKSKNTKNIINFDYFHKLVYVNNLVLIRFLALILFIIKIQKC